MYFNFSTLHCPKYLESSVETKVKMLMKLLQIIGGIIPHNTLNCSKIIAIFLLNAHPYFLFHFWLLFQRVPKPCMFVLMTRKCLYGQLPKNSKYGWQDHILHDPLSIQKFERDVVIHRGKKCEGFWVLLKITGMF